MLKEIEQEDLMWRERRASSKKGVKGVAEEGVPKGETAEGEGGRKPRIRKAVDDTVFL